MGVPFNKFNNWVNELDTKNVNLNADVFKVLLTNTAPVATNKFYADISATELANGNGYTTGGTVVPNTGVTNAAGTDTFVGDQVPFTATGAMGPFRYAVLYDTTAASQPLCGYWDYGSSITLSSGANFTVQFNSQTTGGTIYTLV